MMILELISFVYFSPFVAYMWYLYTLCPSRCLSQLTVQTNNSHCDVVSLSRPLQHFFLTGVISKRLTYSTSSTERHHKFIFDPHPLLHKDLFSNSPLAFFYGNVLSTCPAFNLPSSLLSLPLTALLLLLPLPCPSYSSSSFRDEHTQIPPWLLTFDYNRTLNSILTPRTLVLFKHLPSSRTNYARILYGLLFREFVTSCLIRSALIEFVPLFFFLFIIVIEYLMFSDQFLEHNCFILNKRESKNFVKQL